MKERTMDEILRISRLAKSFGRKNVFRDFDLILEKGKVYGLLGRNGEGKTTLIRMIMGIIPPDQGEIFYKGRRIGFRDTAYKREIGYIPEDCFFYDWMTVREALEMNSSFFPNWDANKVDEYLERFSLDNKAKIRELSRGMKLKLGFVSALGNSPEFLILDDPTSGLDVPTRHDFLRNVIAELAEKGTTILFASHLVHELEKIVEHLFLLHGGRLVLDEPYDAVKNKARRIRIAFAESLPPVIDITDVLEEKRNGARYEGVVYPWDQGKEERLKSLRPVSLEIEPLSLEEIFVSLVSSLPEDKKQS
jgi:ABC-2 type transport system ATP-binding protein